MRRVLEASDHLTARMARAETIDKLYGARDASHHSHQSGAKNDPKIDGRSSEEDRVHMSDASLTASVEAFISNLSANMHDKMFQYDTWTSIEDLWSFLQLVIVRCTIHTLFGSALLKQYPRIVRDYLEFNAAAEGFAPGMPRVMLHGAAKPRDRLLQGMGNWASKGSGQSENSNNTDKGRIWDENTGLHVVRDHIDKRLRTSEGKTHVLKGVAAEVLGITHMYVAAYGKEISIGNKMANKVLQDQRSTLVIYLLDNDRDLTEVASRPQHDDYHCPTFLPNHAQVRRTRTDAEPGC